MYGSLPLGVVHGLVRLKVQGTRRTEVKLFTHSKITLKYLNDHLCDNRVGVVGVRIGNAFLLVQSHSPRFSPVSRPQTDKHDVPPEGPSDQYRGSNRVRLSNQNNCFAVRIRPAFPSPRMEERYGFIAYQHSRYTCYVPIMPAAAFRSISMHASWPF